MNTLYLLKGSCPDATLSNKGSSQFQQLIKSKFCERKKEKGINRMGKFSCLLAECITANYSYLYDSTTLFMPNQ
jgi:hypothetical protein